MCARVDSKQCRQPTCKNDCSGNGKCVSNDDDAGKHCECQKGFVGEDCSENVAGCLAKWQRMCRNGVCIMGKCDCAEGFSGYFVLSVYVIPLTVAETNVV